MSEHVDVGETFVERVADIFLVLANGRARDYVSRLESNYLATIR
ncbi:MAG TPA: hypothetical protein VM580_13740 [Labilithrix sp.]|nr:hypothetical protein [Labilithrix sp.]